MLYRKPYQKVTEEYKFLNRFLDSGYFDRMESKTYDYTLIQEPFTELGYADLVCVRWKKSIKSKWSSKRNNLIKDDIRILHHLYNCREYKSASEIQNDLGFSKKEIEKIINRLFDAELITENKSCNIKIKPKNEIFFLHEIIAIEAKLKDWRCALDQSLNNISFASKSMALFPNKIITDNLLENYRKTEVGILTFDAKYQEIVKPKIKEIPTALTSWYINEFIGRRCYQEC